MKQGESNLVFFAMGEMYNRQCLFAILSLINVYGGEVPDSINIYIYTNQPKFFSVLDSRIRINFIHIDRDIINKWLNGEEYFYVTKIVLVKKFLSDHPGNMIFVDTDVIFKRKIESTFLKVAQGKYVLHLKETELSLPENRHFLDSFQGKKFTLKSGRTISIDGSDEMWNSGLIGVSSDYIAVVEDVLDLCKQLIPHSSSKVLEQLSFGLVFQDAGELVPDRLKLVHYWWKKKSFNPVINKVIDEGYPDLQHLLNAAAKHDPTTRNFFFKWFYSLHPNSLLRRSIIKTSLLLKAPIH